MVSLSLTAFYKPLRIRVMGLVAVGLTGLVWSDRSTGSSFSAETYRNKNSRHFTLLDSMQSLSEADLNPVSRSVIYQYHARPVQFDQAEDGSGAFIPYIRSLHFANEYRYWKNFSVGFEMPLHQLEYFREGVQFSLGDLRLYSKILLYGGLENNWSVAVVPSVHVPSGNSRLLLSNPRGGGGANLVAQRKAGALTSVANLGLDYFPEASFRNVNYDMQLFAGLGINYRWSESWSSQLEWLGRQIHKVRTGDVYAGGEYHFGREQSVFFGASLGAPEDESDQVEYRAMLGLRWLPGSTKVVSRKVYNQVETVKKQKTIRDCGPKPFVREYVGRELTAEEKLQFRQSNLLPYISTAKYPISTLRLGGRNGTTAEGVPYNSEAQVLFAFDLTDLPKRETVISVKAVDLSLKINKIWSETSQKTDIICFLEEKICSGDLLAKKSRSKNINAAYFMGKEPPNDYFMQQVYGPNQTRTESSNVTTSEVSLSLPRLLENSILGDVMPLLYRESKTLYFVVANNVFVHRDVRLRVELSAQACAETTPEPIVEIYKSEPKIEDAEVHHE